MSVGRRIGSRLALLLALALCLAALAACQRREPLPDYWPAPRFSLVDQADAPFDSADLQGRIVVANFVYTTCTDICLLSTAKMREIQERLKQRGLFGSQVVLLSFSVDPVRDTPAVLAAYAERFHADPQGWRFLTGDRDLVRHLLHDGFKVGFPEGQRPRGDDPGWIHTDRFVLIDRAYHVRAFPEMSDLDLDALMADIEALAA